MKASELVSHLTEIMSEHGDLDVDVYESSGAPDDEDEQFSPVRQVVVSKYGTPKSCWISA